MAKDFYVSAPHSLDQSVAQRRIQLLLSETQTMLVDPSAGPQDQWEGNQCRFRIKVGMFPLSGNIRVNPSTVEVRGRLPWGVRRYSDRVEDVLAQRLKALLANGGSPASGSGIDPPFRIV